MGQRLEQSLNKVKGKNREGDMERHLVLKSLETVSRDAVYREN